MMLNLQISSIIVLQTIFLKEKYVSMGTIFAIFKQITCMETNNKFSWYIQKLQKDAN